MNDISEATMNIHIISFKRSGNTFNEKLIIRVGKLAPTGHPEKLAR
jgi:hypothetical protein